MYAQPDGQPGASPLGLSPVVVDGEVFVALRERTLTDGVVIRAMDLTPAEVTSPLDIDAAGAEGLQRHSTRLRGLVLDIHLDLIAAALRPGLTGTPFSNLRLDVEGGQIVAELEVRLDGHEGTIVAAISLGPGPHRALRAYVAPPTMVGFVPLVPRTVMVALFRAAEAVLTQLSPQAGRSLKRVGSGGFSIDAVDALMWAVMPVNGWKVPEHEDAALRGVTVTPAGFVRIVAGEVRGLDEGLDPDLETQRALETRVTAALVREEAAGLAALRDDELTAGRIEAVFRNLAPALDPEHPALVSAVFGLGAALANLHPELTDLAEGLLDRSADVAGRAYLALAAADAADGQTEHQRARLVNAARVLRVAGERRLAGLALRSAAEVAPAEDRARLLEETIALRADDIRALDGLMGILPTVGRAQAAIRAARRLAHLSRDLDARVQAHATAGALLRDALNDPVQARREYERALKLNPHHPAALGGLAATAVKEGAIEEASELYHRLVEQFESEGAVSRAADLLLQVGDLWLPTDPQAALTRYERAHTLDADRVGPLAAMARAAHALGQSDLERRVVNDARFRLAAAEDEEPAAVLVLRRAAARLASSDDPTSDEAVAQLQAALRIAPDDLDTLQALGSLHSARGERTEYARVLGLQARCAVAAKRWDDAAGLFDEQAQVLGDDLERRSEVRAEVADALQLTPGHRGLLDALVSASGTALERLEALDRRLVLEDPPQTRARLLVGLAEALEATERPADAARAYEEAVATGMAPESAMRSLVRIYREKDEPERLALVLARVAAAATEPRDKALAMAERAQMLAKVGRDVDAYAAVQSALAEDDSIADEARSLATQLALRLGHLEDARRHAEARLARSLGAPPDVRLSALLDKADVAQRQRDRDAVIESLDEGRRLVEPASAEGRQLAARLAKALAASERFAALAELERERGRVPSIPSGERAERFIEAARHALRLGEDAQAARDVDEAMAQLESSSADSGLRGAALEVQEQLAQRRGDPVSLAETLGRRAALALDADEQIRLRLEQSAVLVSQGMQEAALQALRQALSEQPDALVIAERLGHVAASIDQHAVAADAFDHAARLADGRSDDGLAIDMHSRAALAHAEIGRWAEAEAHDRAVLAAIPPGRTPTALAASVERLEARARAQDDAALLVEVLGRRATAEAPEQAAALLLERAAIESDRLGRSREALDALRRARTLAPDGSEVARAVEAQLTERLAALGQHAEQAAVLIDRAEHAESPTARAQLLLDAAKIHARLGDDKAALSRVTSAVRVDHQHVEARAFRLDLLRSMGATQTLVDALVGEATVSEGASRASLLMEAATLTVPLDRPDDAPPPDRDALERALTYAQEAANADPTPREPQAAAAMYTRWLGRAQDELVALEQLAPRTADPAERGRLRLRRAMLLDRSDGETAAASAELLRAYDDLKRLAPAAIDIAPADEVFGWLALEQHDDPVVALLSKGLLLTRQIERWEEHLRVLEALIHRAVDDSLVAELYVRSGEVFEEQVLDPSAAESAYRSARRIAPQHQRAQSRLRRLLMRRERFGDLADAFGLSALDDVQTEAGEQLSPSARRHLLAARAERLPAGETAHAEVALALADLELSEASTATSGLTRLRGLAAGAARPEDAVARMLAYYDAHGDAVGRRDVLRLQAERRMGRDRAPVLLALADVLETRLDSPGEAELALREALAADPDSDEAKRRLAQRMISQDLFTEVIELFGPDALSETVTRLLAEGPSSRRRAFAAAAAWVGAHPPQERTDLWLDLADSIELGDDDGGTVQTLLREQVEKTSAPEERQGLYLALAERLMADASKEVPEDPESAAQAEHALRAVLEVDPDQSDARSHLMRMYESQGRFLDLGKVLGLDVLRRIRIRAETRRDLDKARRVTEAMAQLTSGPERASLLLELVPGAGTSPPVSGMSRTEGLFRAALAADPENTEAQEGFRRLLAAEARFRDIAEIFDVDGLRVTVRELETDHSDLLLSAVLALVDQLSEDPDTTSERTGLWVKAARLHRAELDLEAEEYALRLALAGHPDHIEARAQLRTLLVSQDRLTELARVEPALLSEAIVEAGATGDHDLQVRGLRVLAEQEPDSRADYLTQAGRLEVERGRQSAAETDLRAALAAVPDHDAARAALEHLYWSTDRFGAALEWLGPDAFVELVDRNRRKSPPRRTVVAVTAVLEELPVAARAHALEVLGTTVDDAADLDQDRERRLGNLYRGIALADEAGDRDLGARLRSAVAGLLRVGGDPDARLMTLDEAVEYATTPDARGELMLEQAGLLHDLGRTTRALVIARRVLADDGARDAHRFEAARLLVDQLGAEGKVRYSALERLVKGLGSTPEARTTPEDRTRWRQAMARILEAEGKDAEDVIALLEAALADVSDGEEAVDLRRRLLALYDELGDWRAAERHASFLAEVEGTPEQWVGLSELRLWLDDREGARSALERAIAQSPGSRPAHESLVRLARQEGASTSVMDRLEAWAEADESGQPHDRAERLLQAAELAVEARDGVRASELSERAVALLPPDDSTVEAIVDRAARVLAPMGMADERVRLLSRGIEMLPVGQGSPLRLSLAELLRGLGRADEAATVIEQGLHRELSEEDRLLVRFIDNVRSLEPELGARRLLAAAERLGGGPAARRLRVVGAELAEAGGDKESALSAWSRVVREVSATGEGARARAAKVRITRDLDDAPALLDALVEAADDVEDDAERAARLAEAAELADLRLEEPDRAEQLLRRAIQVADDATEMQDALLDLLRRHGRWVTLDAELARLAEARTGAERASLCAERADILRSHLNDEVGAAALFVAAYRADPVPERGADAAAALERAGDLDAAEGLLDSVLEGVEPGTHAWLRVSLAKAESLERSGRLDSAVETLRRAQDAVPSSELVAVRLRQLLLRHRRWDALAEVLLTDASYLKPVDRIRNRLAAARILLRQAHSPDRAVAALRSALRIVQAWLADPHKPMPDHVVPIPASGGWPSVEMTLDSPLLDLASMAADLGQPRLRVDALRLYAQSVPAGAAQQRVLLLLGAAERESGDLDAAEFTLRGAVEAIRGAADAEYEDHVEAYRALGQLLLDRGSAEDALEALREAEAMLQGRGQAGETARAQVLVKLAQAYRVADRPRDAVAALQEARLLDDRVVPPGLVDEAVEAAGPSEALAELLERRAHERELPSERAIVLREAARVWTQLGSSERALAPMLEAYELEPTRPEHAARVQELLYRAERWTELAEHIRRRLDAEPLGGTERVALLLARARLLADPLHRPQEALQAVEEAFTLQPNSVDVLDALAEQAAVCGRLDIQQDALARQAAATPDPQRVLRSLVERAAVLERMDDMPLATRVLEEALERAFRMDGSPRALLDHLARLYAAQGDYAALARLWVRAASETAPVQAAAYLARAAGLRRDALADRRGALAAIEAAIRFQPTELSIRWSAIELAQSLGDEDRALTHASEAARHAARIGLTAGELAFDKVVARIARTLGDHVLEKEAWHRAIRSEVMDAATLDELVGRGLEVAARTQDEPVSDASMAEMDPGGLVEALGEVISGLAAGPTRGHYRLARARLLDALGRGEAAAAERAAAVDEDGVLADLAPDADGGDRLEWARDRLVAGRRLLESSAPDFLQAQALFREALEASPDFVPAWAERARLDLRNGDAEGALEALERLRELGGAPWAPPDLELAIARIRRSRGDLPGAMVAFAQAKLLDPTNREASAGIAGLSERLSDYPTARRWFEDHHALLDPLLDADAVAQLSLAQARHAKNNGAASQALEAVGRALALRPLDGDARQLRLEILEDLGDSPFYLDVLIAEAVDAVDSARARNLQGRAFDLARRIGDRRRGVVLARSLEDRAADDADLLLSLYAFYFENAHHAGLLRVADQLGGIEALGPLPREQRVALATACFEGRRAGDAFAVLIDVLPERGSSAHPAEDIRAFLEDLAQALGLDTGLKDAASQVRLRAVLADMPPEALGRPAVRRALEALVAWQPGARSTRRMLAAAYQRHAVVGPAAAGLYRELLEEDPGDADLLRALAEGLDGPAAVGPRGVLSWFTNEPTVRHPWPALRPAHPGFFERLCTPAVQTPLGQLLRLTAAAMSAVLPPSASPSGPWRSAGDDPRLADVAEMVRAVVKVPLTVAVDREGGHAVHLKPGEPATLVVGEALADDATPDELRFHMARGALLAELGWLLVEQAQGAERRHYVTLAAAAVDPAYVEALPQTLRPAVDLLRSRLDPAHRAAAEPAVAALDDLPLAAWMRGALQAADRFGALMSGAPGTALQALYLAEPRTLAEPLAAPEDRVRAVRRWRSLRELVAFVVSEDYVTLVEASMDGRAFDRF